MLSTPKQNSNLTEITSFLGCNTPEQWIQTALIHQDILLIDHAHCEKKAASTALGLIYRYPDFPFLLQKLSRLAREELRHFEQVLKIIAERKFTFQNLSPSRYAGSLLKHIRHKEPYKLIDTLIVAAFIEARSCERFAALAGFLDSSLQDFYQSLLESEARHFANYLTLAKTIANDDLIERIDDFRQLEEQLILSPDSVFRFHSGVLIDYGITIHL